MINIAIFASGNGSNAEAIARYFTESNTIKVKCVLSNRQNAGVHQRMATLGIPSHTFSKEEWTEAHKIVDFLKKEEIGLIVLAGFLAKIENPIISAFEGHIINIHPSLLPKYGGKGMWGHHIHETVIAAGETKSGITIHMVTDKIDGGKILFQASCEVLPDDTPETLAARIHTLEHFHYPRIIEQMATSNSFT